MQLDDLLAQPLLDLAQCLEEMTDSHVLRIADAEPSTTTQDGAGETIAERACAGELEHQVAGEHER